MATVPVFVLMSPTYHALFYIMHIGILAFVLLGEELNEEIYGPCPKVCNVIDLINERRSHHLAS